jgi:hypothetical protein
VASTVAAPFARALGKTLEAEVEVYQLFPEAARNNTVRLRQMATEYGAALRTLHPRVPELWCNPE